MRLNDHKAKQNRNGTFLGQIEKLNPRYTDWEAIVAFYAAIHLVMAYLHRRSDYDDTRDLPYVTDVKGRTLHRHHHRRAMVQSRILPVYADYTFLEDLANQARYNKVDLGNLSANQVREIRNSLNRIRKVVS